MLDEFQFTVVENKLIETYRIPAHYKYKVQFLLLKIDDWEGDTIDIYLNDLLVKHIDFAPIGNMICENEEES